MTTVHHGCGCTAFTMQRVVEADVLAALRLAKTTEGTREQNMKANHLIFLSMLMLPALQACSDSPSSIAARQSTVAVRVPSTTTLPTSVVPEDPQAACSLVTGTEMSGILGDTVAATPKDGAGVTACSYAPVGGTGARAEIMISWGDGQSTLQMVRAMNNHDPSGDLPYRGIGDDAVYQSPAVVVREGKDLIGVAVFGAPDLPSTVRRIVDTATSKSEFNVASMEAAQHAPMAAR
jgi:hypothetical protein